MTTQQIAERGAYHVDDEAETSPEFTTEYASLISDSADRTRVAAGSQGHEDLVTLLRALCENRQQRCSVGGTR
jgi:hypothetical protein